jgi:hypothetical protein
MQNKQNKQAAASAMNEAQTLPSETLMKEAVSLVKSNEKQQMANALFGGRVVEAGFSFRFVVAEAMKRAGIEKRSLLESIVSNSSALIAPARLVARGEMTEKEFALISPTLAKVAFKAAGGAKDGAGFDTGEWRKQYAIAKEEAEKPKEKIANPPTKPAPALSPLETIQAAARHQLKTLADWEALAAFCREQAQALASK